MNGFGGDLRNKSNQLVVKIDANEYKENNGSSKQLTDSPPHTPLTPKTPLNPLTPLSPNSGKEAIKVIVRCRPFLPNENPDKTPLSFFDGKALKVTLKDKQEKDFTFDKIFDFKATQQDLVCEALPIANQTMKGINGTIFAYGQTSSGKTHTMIGDIENSENQGIIPSLVDHIFQDISQEVESKSLIMASMLEIYNEQIHDLLCKNNKHANNSNNNTLRVVEAPDKTFQVQGLSKHAVTSKDHLLDLIRKGNKNRHTSATQKNQHSSRSHCMMTLHIERSTFNQFKQTLANSERKDTSNQNDAANNDSDSSFQTMLSAKLNLVDLAGSERLQERTKKLAKETKSINQSLSCLAKVICSLTNNYSNSERKFKFHKNSSNSSSNANHVPYRESTLTKLLKDSLGGNSATLMIACINPSMENVNETVSTLRYARNAKMIKNKPLVNEDPKDANLRSLLDELNRLKLLLKEKSERESDMFCFVKSFVDTNKLLFYGNDEEDVLMKLQNTHSVQNRIDYLNNFILQFPASARVAATKWMNNAFKDKVNPLAAVNNNVDLDNADLNNIKNEENSDTNEEESIMKGQGKSKRRLQIVLRSENPDIIINNYPNNDANDKDNLSNVNKTMNGMKIVNDSSGLSNAGNINNSNSKISNLNEAENSVNGEVNVLSKQNSVSDANANGKFDYDAVKGYLVGLQCENAMLKMRLSCLEKENGDNSTVNDEEIIKRNISDTDRNSNTSNNNNNGTSQNNHSENDVVGNTNNSVQNEGKCSPNQKVNNNKDSKSVSDEPEIGINEKEHTHSNTAANSNANTNVNEIEPEIKNITPNPDQSVNQNELSNESSNENAASLTRNLFLEKEKLQSELDIMRTQTEEALQKKLKLINDLRQMLSEKEKVCNVLDKELKEKSNELEQLKQKRIWSLYEHEKNINTLDYLNMNNKYNNLGGEEVFFEMRNEIFQKTSLLNRIQKQLEETTDKLRILQQQQQQQKSLIQTETQRNLNSTNSNTNSDISEDSKHSEKVYISGNEKGSSDEVDSTNSKRRKDGSRPDSKKNGTKKALHPSLLSPIEEISHARMKSFDAEAEEDANNNNNNEKDNDNVLSHEETNDLKDVNDSNSNDNNNFGDDNKDKDENEDANNNNENKNKKDIKNAKLHRDALFKAVKKRKIQTVRELLKTHSDIHVNIRDDKDRTPLHKAISRDCEQMCDLLIETKANVNAVDSVGRTPLHESALVDNVSICSKLIKANAHINAQDKNGSTALLYALEKESMNVTQCLLDQGIDVSLKEKQGASALHYAASAGNKQICKAIITALNRLNPNPSGKVSKIVNMVDNNGRNALYYVLYGGESLDVFKYLVESGASAADFEENSNTVDNDSDDKKTIEDKNDNESFSLLHEAAIRGYTKICCYLVETLNMNVNIQEEEGKTALFFAFLKGERETAKALVELKANVNHKDKHGDAMIHFAALTGDECMMENILRLCFKGYADANGNESSDIIQCYGGYDEIDIDLVDRNGETALEIAFNGGHEAVCSQLLKAGADVFSAKAFEMDANGKNTKVVKMSLLEQALFTPSSLAKLFLEHAIHAQSIQQDECETKCRNENSKESANTEKKEEQKELTTSKNTLNNVWLIPPLHYCSFRGYLNGCRTILQMHEQNTIDVDVNEVDRYNKTALDYALALCYKRSNSNEGIYDNNVGIKSEEQKIVELLIDHGAKISPFDPNNYANRKSFQPNEMDVLKERISDVPNVRVMKGLLQVRNEAEASYKYDQFVNKCEHIISEMKTQLRDIEVSKIDVLNQKVLSVLEKESEEEQCYDMSLNEKREKSLNDLSVRWKELANHIVIMKENTVNSLKEIFKEMEISTHNLSSNAQCVWKGLRDITINLCSLSEFEDVRYLDENNVVSGKEKELDEISKTNNGSNLTVEYKSDFSSNEPSNIRTNSISTLESKSKSMYSNTTKILFSDVNKSLNDLLNLSLIPLQINVYDNNKTNSNNNCSNNIQSLNEEKKNDKVDELITSKSNNCIHPVFKPLCNDEADTALCGTLWETNGNFVSTHTNKKKNSGFTIEHVKNAEYVSSHLYTLSFQIKILLSRMRDDLIEYSESRYIALLNSLRSLFTFFNSMNHLCRAKNAFIKHHLVISNYNNRILHQNQCFFCIYESEYRNSKNNETINNESDKENEIIRNFSDDNKGNGNNNNIIFMMTNDNNFVCNGRKRMFELKEDMEKSREIALRFHFEVQMAMKSKGSALNMRGNLLNDSQTATNNNNYRKFINESDAKMNIKRIDLLSDFQANNTKYINNLISLSKLIDQYCNHSKHVHDDDNNIKEMTKSSPNCELNVLKSEVLLELSQLSIERSILLDYMDLVPLAVDQAQHIRNHLTSRNTKPINMHSNLSNNDNSNMILPPANDIVKDSNMLSVLERFGRCRAYNIRMGYCCVLKPLHLISKSNPSNMDADTLYGNFNEEDHKRDVMHMYETIKDHIDRVINLNCAGLATIKDLFYDSFYQQWYIETPYLGDFSLHTLLIRTQNCIRYGHRDKSSHLNRHSKKVSRKNPKKPKEDGQNNRNNNIGSNGDNNDIKNNGSFGCLCVLEPEQILLLVRNMFLSLEILHRKGFAHRHIRPHSFLFPLLKDNNVNSEEKDFDNTSYLHPVIVGFEHYLSSYINLDTSSFTPDLYSQPNTLQEISSISHLIYKYLAPEVRRAIEAQSSSMYSYYYATDYESNAESDEMKLNNSPFISWRKADLYAFGKVLKDLTDTLMCLNAKNKKMRSLYTSKQNELNSNSLEMEFREQCLYEYSHVCESLSDIHTLLLKEDPLERPGLPEIMQCFQTIMPLDSLYSPIQLPNNYDSTNNSNRLNNPINSAIINKNNINDTNPNNNVMMHGMESESLKCLDLLRMKYALKVPVQIDVDKLRNMKPLEALHMLNKCVEDEDWTRPFIKISSNIHSESDSQSAYLVNEQQNNCSVNRNNIIERNLDENNNTRNRITKDENMDLDSFLLYLLERSAEILFEFGSLTEENEEIGFEDEEDCSIIEEEADNKDIGIDYNEDDNDKIMDVLDSKEEVDVKQDDTHINKIKKDTLSKKMKNKKNIGTGTFRSKEDIRDIIKRSSSAKSNLNMSNFQISISKPSLSASKTSLQNIEEQNDIDNNDDDNISRNSSKKKKVHNDIYSHSVQCLPRADSDMAEEELHLLTVWGKLFAKCLLEGVHLCNFVSKLPDLFLRYLSLNPMLLEERKDLVAKNQQNNSNDSNNNDNTNEDEEDMVIDMIKAHQLQSSLHCISFNSSAETYTADSDSLDSFLGCVEVHNLRQFLMDPVFGLRFDSLFEGGGDIEVTGRNIGEFLDLGAYHCLIGCRENSLQHIWKGFHSQSFDALHNEVLNNYNHWNVMLRNSIGLTYIRARRLRYIASGTCVSPIIFNKFVQNINSNRTYSNKHNINRVVEDKVQYGLSSWSWLMKLWDPFILKGFVDRNNNNKDFLASYGSHKKSNENGNNNENEMVMPKSTLGNRLKNILKNLNATDKYSLVRRICGDIYEVDLLQAVCSNEKIVIEYDDTLETNSIPHINPCCFVMKFPPISVSEVCSPSGYNCNDNIIYCTLRSVIDNVPAKQRALSSSPCNRNITSNSLDTDSNAKANTKYENENNEDYSECFALLNDIFMNPSSNPNSKEDDVKAIDTDAEMKAVNCNVEKNEIIDNELSNGELKVKSEKECKNLHEEKLNSNNNNNNNNTGEKGELNLKSEDKCEEKHDDNISDDPVHVNDNEIKLNSENEYKEIVNENLNNNNNNNNIINDNCDGGDKNDNSNSLTVNNSNIMIDDSLNDDENNVKGGTNALEKERVPLLNNSKQVANGGDIDDTINDTTYDTEDNQLNSNSNSNNKLNSIDSMGDIPYPNIHLKEDTLPNPISLSKSYAKPIVMKSTLKEKEISIDSMEDVPLPNAHMKSPPPILSLPSPTTPSSLGATASNNKYVFVAIAESQVKQQVRDKEGDGSNNNNNNNNNNNDSSHSSSEHKQSVFIRDTNSVSNSLETSQSYEELSSLSSSHTEDSSSALNMLSYNENEDDSDGEVDKTKVEEYKGEIRLRGRFSISKLNANLSRLPKKSEKKRRTPVDEKALDILEEDESDESD